VLPPRGNLILQVKLPKTRDLQSGYLHFSFHFNSDLLPLQFPSLLFTLFYFANFKVKGEQKLEWFQRAPISSKLKSDLNPPPPGNSSCLNSEIRHILCKSGRRSMFRIWRGLSVGSHVGNHHLSSNQGLEPETTQQQNMIITQTNCV